MPNEPVFIYWDSCVFLAAVNADPTRIATLRTILREVAESKGERKIVTSIVSKLEVAFAASEQLKRALEPEAEKKIDALWADDTVIGLIDLNHQIVEIARRLKRAAMVQGWKLRPMDAIHLASANWIKARELQTYDMADLNKFAGDINVTVCEPYVTQQRLAI